MDREAIQERFGIIGSSHALKQVIDRIRMVAPTDITVLLTGESGTGKELMAKATHALSPRRRNTMVTINCGAIPEGLIESELFGAEKGAYTGSVERRIGHFEEADKGTIFLDEIGEMPLSAQVRLLRVLETGEFSRVGSSNPLMTDVRVIAATNKDLGKEVQVGRFREDLYYRLSTVLIDLPPLRQRQEDIVPIFETYLQKFAQKYDAPFKRLDSEAIELITHYHWPGNVRELRNVAEQAVVLTRGTAVSVSQLKSFLRGVSANGTPGLVLASEARKGEEPGETRERELIYRMLLEVRLELRELKQLVESATEATFASQKDSYPAYTPDRESSNLPVPRSQVEPQSEDQYGWVIEDAPYEIQNEPEPVALFESGKELPTIEEAERALIVEALRRFDGNRRQTAKALNISERTLYRKLKDMDIDG